MKTISHSYYVSLVIFLLIVSSGSILGYVIDNNRIYMLLSLLSIPTLGYVGKIKYNNNLLITCFFYLILLTFIQLLTYTNGIILWGRTIVLIIVSSFFSIYTIIKRVNVVKIYYYLFLFLCGASLLVYSIVEVYKMPFPHFFFSNGWLRDYNSYYYIYNSSVDSGLEPFLGFEFKRNSGPFSEPGLYAVFIVIDLFIYHFLKLKKNLFELIILLSSLFTTFSTTGYICYLIILIFVFNSSKKQSGLSKVILFLVSVIVAYNIILTMLELKQIQHSFSFTARSYDIWGGLQLFFENPIWGCGFKNNDAFYGIQKVIFVDERGCSNGIVSILYQLGIIGFVFFATPFYLAYKKIKLRKSSFVAFMIILFLLLIGQPIQYSSLFLAIVCYLFVFVSIRANAIRIKF